MALCFTKSLLIFVVLLLVSSIVSASETSDFIVVENIRQCTLFNEYEQVVQTDEALSFPANVPLQVENWEVMLGDAISHTIKCRFEAIEFNTVQTQELKLTSH